MNQYKGPEGFDAIVCMGNSFAHLPDFQGDQHDHRLAIANFYGLLKPGGVLIIDHRNYDYILENGSAPTKNIYYNVIHILFFFKLHLHNSLDLAISRGGLEFFKKLLRP